MQLSRANGFLYTKHPIRVLAPQQVVPAQPVSDDGKMVGYAYTARRLPRPTRATVPKAWEWLTIVFGYAYTARYERIHDEQLHDDQIERVAA